ncbi:MAG: hypothetical protein RIC15_05370 [Vicingaceae bacterium]
MLTQTSNTRLWIYRSVKELTDEQKELIYPLCHKFISEWSSHGQKLDADFRILDGHFLIFFVNEVSAKASGCSIDSSVALIKQLESEFKLGLLDRMSIPFRIEDKVVMINFQDIPALYKKGDISDNSLVYNLLLQDGSLFEEQWLIPFSSSVYFQSIL